MVFSIRRAKATLLLFGLFLSVLFTKHELYYIRCAVTSRVQSLSCIVCLIIAYHNALFVLSCFWQALICRIYTRVVRLLLTFDSYIYIYIYICTVDIYSISGKVTSSWKERVFELNKCYGCLIAYYKTLLCRYL